MASASGDGTEVRGLYKGEGQSSHEGLEVTVPISFLHFHPDDPPQ